MNIFQAVIAGNTRRVKRLLDGGLLRRPVNANARIEYLKLPYGDCPWLSRLFNRRYWTPLHCAAREGHTEIAALLLDYGADVNVTDAHSIMPLHCAASEGHTETAAVLLSRGAKVNGPGVDPRSMWAHRGGPRTALHSAASGGHTETAALLLDHGADVNPATKGNWMPLHSAASGGHTETVALLLDRGADVEVLAEVWEARSEKGCESVYMKTPLHCAASEGRTETAALLLSRGAKVNAEGYLGETPLHCAVMWNHADTAALLLDHGADTEVRSDDGTPLRLARTLSEGWSGWTSAGHGHIPARNRRDVIHLLVERGASLTNAGWDPRW